MKLAVAILLVCVAIPHAFGFSFPSFDSNEAFEQIKEAGKQIIEKAKGHAEEVQETVQRKKAELEELPTESMREMWRQIKEKAGDHEAKWQERKKQMKEMWENMKEKAGENKEVFKKMWKENKKNLRDVTEEKWNWYKSLTAEQLEQAKQEIDALLQKLGTNVPEKPWKAMKDMRLKMKDMIIGLKESFKVKLNEMKEELEPITEEEEEPEESFTEEPFTEEPFTEEPFTDELATTIPNTSEEIPYTSEPTEVPSIPATEVLPTEYSEEDIDGNENWSAVDQEVVNDEPEEDDDQDEVLPEVPVEEEDDEEDSPSEEEQEEDGDEGAVEETTQTQESTSPIKVFSRIMSARRNRKMKEWLKRGHAMKTTFKKAWKNWLEKNRGENSEGEP